ncbi:MAG: hypothetical protein K6C41_05735 [Lachnospiraceae bacterium]|nr:hypothetical protein [Lachnospiraceae bacterium]
MADNKNMELNDEMMAKASGGIDGGLGSGPKYKIGDRVHYELTNPTTGETMAVNGTIVAVEFVNEAKKWRYTINTEPNPYNVTEVKATEDHLRYA